MDVIPEPMDDYNGETVQYSTSYQIDDQIINQHFIIGFLLCLTIIGLIIGVPIILRGWEFKRNKSKAIIITNKAIYEIKDGKRVWRSNLKNIENVKWRSSLTGMIELKFYGKQNKTRIIRGNFYENEMQMIINLVKKSS